MAATPEAAALTRAYNQGARALRAAAIRDLMRIWPMMDVRDIDRSWAALEAALKSLVLDKRRAVADLAASYLRGFRRFEGVTGDLDVVFAGAYDPDALHVSLQVTGPVAIKQALATGASASAALDRGLVSLSGSVTRMVLGGGRDTIERTVQADSKALGLWRRVTNGKACWWCVMLASRGAVYKSKESASDPRGRKHKYHDHCRCEVEVVYREDTRIASSTQRYEQLWVSSTAGLGGQEALTAFRRAYEATL